MILDQQQRDKLLTIGFTRNNNATYPNLYIRLSDTVKLTIKINGTILVNDYPIKQAQSFPEILGILETFQICYCVPDLPICRTCFGKNKTEQTKKARKNDKIKKCKKGSQKNTDKTIDYEPNYPY